MITFATDDNMEIFWGFVKILLNFASPFVLIAISIMAVSLLIMIVVIAFKNAHKSTYKNDDDDIDIRHY